MKIALEKPTRDALARALGKHLKDELDVEIGGMEAVPLIDFISETLGPTTTTRRSTTPRPT